MGKEARTRSLSGSGSAGSSSAGGGRRRSAFTGGSSGSKQNSGSNTNEHKIPLPGSFPSSPSSASPSTSSASTFASLATTSDSRANLIRKTGGVDYWPVKPLKNSRGEYIIRKFNTRLSQDPYL